jgi:hypothetical protein
LRWPSGERPLPSLELRGILLLTFFLAAATFQAAETAATQTEILGVNAPDEFEVGYQGRNDSIQMIEMVQPPETVDTWTKLITLQLFFNAAKREGADAFYERWRNAMHQTCAGTTDISVQGMVDGMHAIKSSLSCPKNPQTGKPENLVAVVVQGNANLMMVQIAFRHPLGTTDNALVQRIIRSLKVCDQRAFSNCSARKATGFLPSQ